MDNEITTETTTQTTSQPRTKEKKDGAFKKTIGFIGADNLSLIFALVALIFLISVVSGWFGLNGGGKVLLLAEHHEQPRPGHRDRRAARHR